METKKNLIGRIEYLGTNGIVGETVEYSDEKAFVEKILEENHYGAPMKIILYRDKSGNTIDKGFLKNLDPPVAVIGVADAPDIPQRIKKLVEDMMEYAKKSWEIGDEIANITGVNDAIFETLTCIQECSLTDPEEAVKEILEEMEETEEDDG